MSIVIVLFAAGLLLAGIGIILNKQGKNDKLNSFSVCIAARNEEQVLPRTLDSLSMIDYPQEFYEIILVDDSSRDKTGEIMEDFAGKKQNVRVIRLKEEQRTLPGKKAALQKALESAGKDIILLTDADCLVSPQWLRDSSRYWEEETKMLVGYAPEEYSSLIENSSFAGKIFYSLRRFSQNVTAGIFAATIGLGVPFSCYGRNLAFSRKLMINAGGYHKIGRDTAGDDKQVLNLFRQLPGKIRYSPQRNVVTYPELENFSDQQKRRFGKLKMSSPLHYCLTLLVIGFFIYLPLRVVLGSDYRSLLIYYLSALTVWLINLIKHQERFMLPDLIFIIIYPYYMIYYTVLGTKGGWHWKD